MLPRPEGRSKTLHTLYVIAVCIKGIDGFLETLGGIALVITGSLTSLIPFIGPYLAAYTQLFAGTYLLIHGIIKMVLVYALIRQKHWAYKLALVVLTAFIVYQTIAILLSFSYFLFAVTAIDIGIVWLVWKEYQALHKLHEA